MYRECWIGAEQAVELLLLVVVLCLFAAISAAIRNLDSARKYRKLYGGELEENRRLRRSLSWHDQEQTIRTAIQEAVVDGRLTPGPAPTCGDGGPCDL